MTFLEPHQDKIFALTRIVVGFMFFCHGAQKVLGILNGADIPMPAPMLWSAALIEAVGGAMIAIGFRTGLAAFICSGTMAVAYFLAHQKDGLLPIQNGGELAALYSFVLLAMAARNDSGIWSVDGPRSR